MFTLRAIVGLELTSMSVATASALFPRCSACGGAQAAASSLSQFTDAIHRWVMPRMQAVCFTFLAFELAPELLQVLLVGWRTSPEER
jgi:hypothetical protein